MITKIEGENVFKGTKDCHITIPGSVAEIKGTFLPAGCSVSISPENGWIFVSSTTMRTQFPKIF